RRWRLRSSGCTYNVSGGGGSEGRSPAVSDWTPPHAVQSESDGDHYETKLANPTDHGRSRFRSVRRFPTPGGSRSWGLVGPPPNATNRWGPAAPVPTWLRCTACPKRRWPVNR